VRRDAARVFQAASRAVNEDERVSMGLRFYKSNVAPTL